MTKEESKELDNIKALNRIGFVFTGVTYEDQLFLNKLRSKELDKITYQLRNDLADVEKKNDKLRKPLVMLREMITLNGANANTVMMH